MAPVELFGRTEFPPIGDLPYFLTLGPHAFYWFALEPPRAAAAALPAGPAAAEAPLPEVAVAGARWPDVFDEASRGALDHALAGYVRGRRWFGAKARRLRAVQLREAIRFPYGSEVAYVALVAVQYAEGDPETYALPLAFASGDRAAQALRDTPHAVVARLRLGGDGPQGVLYDALVESAFSAALLEAITRRHRIRGAAGELAVVHTQAFRRVVGAPPPPAPAPVRAEQSNTSVVYGDRAILKLFRRLEPGQNLDLEVGRFLTERAAFPHTPAVAAAVEYRPARGDATTLAVLQQFVPNEGDAWRYTLDALDRYCERALAERAEGAAGTDLATDEPILALAARPLPDAVYAEIGEYANRAELLGQRTAELHEALASDPTDPAFAPEPMTPFDQRSLYQSGRALARQTLLVLRKNLRTLPDELQAAAQQIVDAEGALLARFHSVLGRKPSGMRIRVHGDYHLGQVLYTGKDFVIIDFEGEPARTLTERRLKRSALRDVAGMLRSFHYAAHTALHAQAERGAVSQLPGAFGSLEARVGVWRRWACAAFLRGYLEAAGGAAFLPRTREEIQALLDVHLLEKAVYELRYELNNRPAWVGIPIEGILELLSGRG